jgi:nucleoporin NUP159
MKKEEASRYLRARQNPEFLEKFIKPRGLGPEHSESQVKLRKGLKVSSCCTEIAEKSMLILI